MENPPEEVNFALLSQLDPISFKEVRDEEQWIQPMNEELDPIERNNTWELVPRSKDKDVFGTKWFFLNKLTENGEVIRNKEKLLCKGCAQIEGIDVEGTFSPVVRLK